MTKHKQFGETKISVENADKLTPGTGVEGYEYGSDLQTEGVPVMDPGVGKTISIRVFDFKMDPLKAKNFNVDQQTLFNTHASQIKTILWADGLIPMEQASPRVVIHKKKKMYQILIACEPRLHQTIIEKPQSLTKLLKPKNPTPMSGN